MLNGKSFQVVEVLSDGPSLVVECDELKQRIQANQFGNGNRRVPESHIIPVYGNPEQTVINPAIEMLLNIIESE